MRKERSGKPSANHRNRQMHNWLMYESQDKALKKYGPYLRGVTYDLGCGERPYESFLLRFVARYVGVDWSNTRHNLKADIVANLNEPLPIDTAVADAVVSFSVLEHLYEPQIMLNEAYRILRPGGTILVQVPWQWRVHEAPHDYYRYTPYGLKHMFGRAGFTNVVVEPQTGFFSTWILKINYFSTSFVAGPVPLRWAIKAILVPFWCLGQILAPFLDKLDRNWNLEASGYCVIATKP